MLISYRFWTCLNIMQILISYRFCTCARLSFSIHVPLSTYTCGVLKRTCCFEHFYFIGKSRCHTNCGHTWFLYVILIFYFFGWAHVDMVGEKRGYTLDLGWSERICIFITRVPAWLVVEKKKRFSSLGMDKFDIIRDNYLSNVILSK